MSYCRWSNDDYQCDVYVYESCNGFMVHVAGRKYVFKEPVPEHVPFDKEHQKEWYARHKKVLRMCDEADQVAIGLPNDGETYDFSSPGKCAEFLIELKKSGYSVPQHAIDDLTEEENETDT